MIHDESCNVVALIAGIQSVLFLRRHHGYERREKRILESLRSILAALLLINFVPRPPDEMSPRPAALLLFIHSIYSKGYLEVRNFRMIKW